MPDRPSGGEDADRDRESFDSDREPSDSSDDGVSADPASTSSGDDDAEADEFRKARIAAAKRRYRATLRNEADTGGGGFSEDYYRSQKPPHWS
ncbi:hypothetical protein [Brevibacterium linens]|uniref:Uncharacterized protein n=1 Tax=Brevibacterium linens ATCC 9172 TaxID=1255617 RepID=A0A2H1KR43_BRELN|nr:hypothetical protein [Brevibacterium linens]KAB1942592.1 hypothetical protein F8227_16855 [Brevibacterium linens ATCC 9172]SMY01702.1 hypothetical protein BLIN9172_03415 [Brevibacterium linens ATCC 9172]